MNTLTQKSSNLKISTVEEKILLEKHLPFDPNNKRGPTIDLYFHELASDKNIGQKMFRFAGSLLVGMFFLITLPAIAFFIKVLSRESVFRKVNVPGRRGMIFQQYLYSTEHSDTQQTFAFGAFLKKSKLEKLPSIINVWKGEMDLVGPRPYPAKVCNKWNKQLSDFYKRFAQPPGFFNVTEPVDDYENTDRIANSLRQELRYILNPTLKKDVRRLFRIN